MQNKKTDFCAPSWKATLEKNFFKWMNGLEIPPKDLKPGQIPPPDIYSFYAELSTLRSEIHRRAKRDHDAANRFREILSQFDQTLRTLAREQLKQIRSDHLQKNEDAYQRAFRLSVVDIYERFKRIEAKLDNPPSRGKIFSASSNRDTNWNSLREGFVILREHFQRLLSHEGIHPIKCEGYPFDPNSMKAVDFELIDTVAPNTVLEELVGGYVYQKRVLKYAEVKVAVAKGD